MSLAYDVIQRDVRDQLGEGPLWSARESAIYWVDILAPALYRYSLAEGSVHAWAMPEKIGWVVERRNRPGFIAGFQSGFFELELDPFARRQIIDPEPQYPNNRLNDAKVDSFGRLWAGTMDVEIRAATGSLYRLDPDLTLARMDEGYRITNGPAFCPTYDRMYHNDTELGLVYSFDMTPDGTIANKKVFLRFTEESGRPDGMTVDVEGCLWIARWGAGRVSRYTPDGVLDREVKLPASQITSCVFAGDNLDRMFVTSAAVDRTDEPLAGALFEIDPGVKGFAPNQFAG